MIATFQPCTLQGALSAPPSKSMAHRYLIGAALSGKVCTLSGVDYSEDILATIDCLQALGANITVNRDVVTVDPTHFMKTTPNLLPTRESGSTLRFLIPLCLCMGKEVTLSGSPRLLERPLEVYEDLCLEKNFLFQKQKDAVTLCGNLQTGTYQIRGDISSQFITGLMFALVFLGGNSVIRILPPFESRSYINLSISALSAFGAKVSFTDEYTIAIEQGDFRAYCGRIEGDYSNAAFLDAFNYMGSHITLQNLNPKSLQGDKVYQQYFKLIQQGTPTLDLSDCPDLGPILFALAAMKNGAVFTGTDRLKAKESDRGVAMHEELVKLGGGLLFGNNTITVPKQKLQYQNLPLYGHNDHRIVMALSVILMDIGGKLSGVEAVRKSYPGFFLDLQKLGAKVEIT